MKRRAEPKIDLMGLVSFRPEMRVLLVATMLLAAACAHASRVLLVPLDSRPAAGQFAQMIGAMSGAEVQMPPYDLLGRFTTPGNPEGILDWLRKQDFTDVSAVVVSTDMIAYGGLIASRVPDTSLSTALHRLDSLRDIAKRRRNTKFYAFSAIMRLSPTAMKSTNRWRLTLAKYVAGLERAQRTKDTKLKANLQVLLKRIPSGQLERYEKARDRDHNVQRVLVQMAKDTFDYLVLGQDDAQPYGPHVPERLKLKALSEKLGVSGKVYFCEGVDQDSNVLVSRALLRANSWVPRIRVIYSDELGRKKIAAFESKSIEQSLRDQIFASGARPALSPDDADFTVYVNTPGRRALSFNIFLNGLIQSIDSGAPLCIADINLRSGISDPELFAGLLPDRRIMKVLSFAGWNTAGNTMGTAIPAANMALLAKRIGADAVKTQIAQKEFLLHRIVDDVLFHRYTRPQTYSLIKSFSGASPDEAYGEALTIANAYVRKDVVRRLNATFVSQLQGLNFTAGETSYQFTNVNQPRVFLPWPRAYEMRLEFGLGVQPVLGH